MDYEKAWKELHGHLTSINEMMQADPQLVSGAYAIACRDILANMNSAEAEYQQQDSSESERFTEADARLNYHKQRLDNIEARLAEYDVRWWGFDPQRFMNLEDKGDALSQRVDRLDETVSNLEEQVEKLTKFFETQVYRIDDRIDRNRNDITTIGKAVKSNRRRLRELEAANDSDS